MMNPDRFRSAAMVLDEGAPSGAPWSPWETVRDYGDGDRIERRVNGYLTANQDLQGPMRVEYRMTTPRGPFAVKVAVEREIEGECWRLELIGWEDWAKLNGMPNPGAVGMFSSAEAFAVAYVLLSDETGA